MAAAKIPPMIAPEIEKKQDLNNIKSKGVS